MGTREGTKEKLRHGTYRIRRTRRYHGNAFRSAHGTRTRRRRRRRRRTRKRLSRVLEEWGWGRTMGTDGLGRGGESTKKPGRARQRIRVPHECTPRPTTFRGLSSFLKGGRKSRSKNGSESFTTVSRSSITCTYAMHWPQNIWIHRSRWPRPRRLPARTRVMGREGGAFTLELSLVVTRRRWSGR